MNLHQLPSQYTHRYLSRPLDEKLHASVDGKALGLSLVDVTELASANREMAFKEVLINGKQRVDLPLTPLVYVTKDEREEASHLKNMKKADLDKRIESLYPNYQMNQQSYFIRNSYITSKRSWHPPRKKSLLPPVNRLSSQQNYLMYRIRKIQKQMNDFHKFCLLFIFNSEQ